MKKFSIWFLSYGIILLGVLFFGEFVYPANSENIQTSAKAMEVPVMETVSKAAIEFSEIPKESKIEKVSKKKKTKKVDAKKTAPKKTKKTVKKEVKKSSAKSANLKMSDKEILEKIVEAEAGGQDMKGRVLVANVILNRLRKEKYPDTVKGVVFASRDGVYQFSPVKDGRIYKVQVSKKTRQAVKKALNGTDYSKGALYFMNRSTANPKNVRWFDSRLTRLFKHGSHEFFR